MWSSKVFNLGIPGKTGVSNNTLPRKKQLDSGQLTEARSRSRKRSWAGSTQPQTGQRGPRRRRAGRVRAAAEKPAGLRPAASARPVGRLRGRAGFVPAPCSGAGDAGSAAAASGVSCGSLSRRHHAAARVHPETAPQNQPPHGGHRALRRDSPVSGGRHPSGQGNRSHLHRAWAPVVRTPCFSLRSRPQPGLPGNRRTRSSREERGPAGTAFGVADDIQP